MSDTDERHREEGADQSRKARVLTLLEQRGERVTVGELAHDVFRADADADDPGQVHEDLFERVLPSLDSRGLLRFDESSGVVSGRRGDRRTSLLSLLPLWVVVPTGLVAVGLAFSLLHVLT